VDPSYRFISSEIIPVTSLKILMVGMWYDHILKRKFIILSGSYVDVMAERVGFEPTVRDFRLRCARLAPQDALRMPTRRRF